MSSLAIDHIIDLYIIYSKYKIYIPVREIKMVMMMGNNGQ